MKTVEIRLHCVANATQDSFGDLDPGLERVMTYLTNHRVRNPKGCQKVAGGRSVAQTPGTDRSRIRTLKGCQPNSVTLSGSKYNCLLIRGYRYAQPPATISQPDGLPRSYL